MIQMQQVFFLLKILDEISKHFDELFNSLTELEGISVGGTEANSAQAADLSEITEKNEELARQVEDYEKEKQELMKEISGLQATNKTMTKKLDDSTKMQGALDKRLTELEKKSKGKCIFIVASVDIFDKLYKGIFDLVKEFIPYFKQKSFSITRK